MTTSSLPTSAFWHGKRVLVTGHTGFKGSWLCLWLQQLGAHVTGLALAPATQPSLFEVAHVSQGMHSVIADIRNAPQVREIANNAAPDIVLHLAAQPLVRYSYHAPLETIETNVLGTAYLLDALRYIASARAVVVVTTDKCYQNHERLTGYREDDALGGHDPYSSSKACAELITASYRDSFFHAPGTTAVATARAGNVIGGGDWAADRLIPDVLKALADNCPVRIRYPQAIRPWQHVLDPLTGYLMLAERLFNEGQAFAEAWNFGPDDADARPVRWIAEQLTSDWGGGAQWINDGEAHPHETTYLKLDASKARERLGWQPRWPLATALIHTISWQRAWLAGKEMHEVCLKQLADYLSSTSM